MSRRFVILRHVVPESAERDNHWDLMLEFDETLRTWALADQPQCNTETDADILPDHRLAYLEYEGPISGNRGQVTRVESGSFHIIQHTEKMLVVKLLGKDLRCQAEITSVGSKRVRIAFGETQ